MALAFLTVFWIILYMVPDEFDHKLEILGEIPRSHQFLVNVIKRIEHEEGRFDFLLASISGLVWIKFIMFFRATKTFGPMLKITYKMVMKLG